MKPLLIFLGLFCIGVVGGLNAPPLRRSIASQLGTPQTVRRRCDAGCDKRQSGPEFTYEELWQLQIAFWDSFMYPANVKQAEVINSTLFAENVQGRVDVTRTFDGRELNTEYIYAGFTSSNFTSILSLPKSYEIVKFAAHGDIAAASTIVTFTSSLFNATFPMMIDSWIAWNEQHQIVQYDMTFKWSGFLYDTLINKTAERLGVSPSEAIPQIARTMATGICDVHDKYCTGENQQYQSSAECLDFLTTAIRFGREYEVGRNTLVCRSDHQKMAQYRPSVHCPHIGPTGGGMCVDDQTYEEKVLEKYFTNVPFVSPSLSQKEA